MITKNNLFEAMNTYGQMLHRINCPGNIFLFRG